MVGYNDDEAILRAAIRALADGPMLLSVLAITFPPG
jgi:spore germination protein GerM